LSSSVNCALPFLSPDGNSRFEEQQQVQINCCSSTVCPHASEAFITHVSAWFSSLQPFPRRVAAKLQKSMIRLSPQLSLL
jgi:hypothetical protein